jgi:hypothetical protein
MPFWGHKRYLPLFVSGLRHLTLHLSIYKQHFLF